MSKPLFQVACGIAVIAVLLAVPSRVQAQSITESVSKLSHAELQSIVNTSATQAGVTANRHARSLRRRAVIGVLIGTIGGLVAGYPLYRYCSNEAGNGCARIPLKFAALGAAVGTVIAVTP